MTIRRNVEKTSNITVEQYHQALIDSGNSIIAARIGELVVDITTDPNNPTVYVANNTGYLNAIVSGSGNSVPGGPNSAVQFQNGLGSFGGSSKLTFDPNAGNLNLTGNLIVGNVTVTDSITNAPTYGLFWSNVSQTANAAGTEYQFTFNNTDGVNNVTLGTGAANSRVIINKVGKFNIQFSTQINKTGGAGVGSATLWFKKNGTAIPSSGGFFTVDNNIQAVQSWNIIADVANVGDYVEIAYSVTNTNINFPAIAGNATIGYPDVPSIIITVTPAGV